MGQGTNKRKTNKKRTYWLKLTNTIWLKITHYCGGKNCLAQYSNYTSYGTTFSRLNVLMINETIDDLERLNAWLHSSFLIGSRCYEMGEWLDEHRSTNRREKNFYCFVDWGWFTALQLFLYLAAHGGGEKGREDVGPVQLIAATP